MDQRYLPRSDLILKRLLGLHPKVIDLSLDRVHALLADLGRPELALPPVLHVAGTNGKGSAIAYLRAALEAAGRRVHVYTSPHLVAFNERIRLAGRLIGDDALAELLDECERVNDGRPITYFEITTAAAFLAFARTPADILLLETGLGGRLDATNVLERPLLTAITPVSLDHQHFLGNDLGGIAAEKAGILKPGVAAVVAAQPPVALAAIERRAAEIGAPLALSGRDWRSSAEAGGLVFEDALGVLRLPAPALPGAHQVENAGVALACLRRLGGLAGDEASLARGIAGAEWPARLQRLTAGPLPEALPDGEVWLDGGHNPAAGEALAATLAAWQAARPRPLHLVCGMLTSKDAAGFLAPFRPLEPRVHAIAVPGESASMDAGVLAAAAEQAGLACGTADGPLQAVRRLAGADPDALVLVCGSLYLAGAVLAENR